MGYKYLGIIFIAITTQVVLHCAKLFITERKNDRLLLKVFKSFAAFVDGSRFGQRGLKHLLKQLFAARGFYFIKQVEDRMLIVLAQQVHILKRLFVCYKTHGVTASFFFFNISRIPSLLIMII